MSPRRPWWLPSTAALLVPGALVLSACDKAAEPLGPLPPASAPAATALVIDVAGPGTAAQGERVTFSARILRRDPDGVGDDALLSVGHGTVAWTWSEQEWTDVTLDGNRFSGRPARAGILLLGAASGGALGERHLQVD
ncbi:MAG: hypothetical protein NW201_01825 [Gemmatimonadales bacterium]|nr:hypothetical protein [Gemmatimonadales bacterium]